MNSLICIPCRDKWRGGGRGARSGLSAGTKGLWKKRMEGQGQPNVPSALRASSWLGTLFSLHPAELLKAVTTQIGGGGDLQYKTALFWQVASWVAGSPFSHQLRPPRGLAIRCAHSPGIRSQAWVLPRPSVLRAQSHRVLRIPGVRLKEDEPCEPRKHSKCGAGLGHGWPWTNHFPSLALCLLLYSKEFE